MKLMKHCRYAVGVAGDVELVRNFVKKLAKLGNDAASRPGSLTNAASATACLNRGAANSAAPSGLHSEVEDLPGVIYA